MERLTKYLASGVAAYAYPESPNCFCDRVSKSAYRQRCVERLAAYEDTGLTPKEVPTAVEMAQIYSIIEENKRYRALNVTVDRIKELAKADKENRVVIYDTREEAEEALKKGEG